MNAIDILEAEHKGAKKVLEEIESATGPRKKEIFMALKHELEVHDKIEEEIFYPSVSVNPATSSLPAMDKDAHQPVERALAHLAELSVDDAGWTPAFDSMKVNILKHVAAEEMNYFVKIREVMSAAELNQIGERMKAEKARLTAVAA